jgi:ABC-2 type transport system permease protein
MRDGLTIAARDALDLWRDGRFRWAATLLLAILATALLTGWATARSTARLRADAERSEREVSLNKGEMNPHSAAHFGAFVFKPVEPLSAIDPGIDPYVGAAAFLEAHQQQLARYRPVEDATAARRLGELSAAVGLQVLVPLLIVLLTFPAFAGERDTGTLRQLASLGTGRWPLAAGKIAGAMLPLGAVLIPATAIGVAGMMWSAPAADGDALVRAVLLSAIYLAYFLTWAAAGLAISAKSPSAMTALGVLVAAWFVNCFVAPPLASALAKMSHPAMTAAEFATALDDARAGLPRWDERVAGVEERFLNGELSSDAGVPSNPEVVALVEAETDETAMFDRLFDGLFDAYDAQAALYGRIGHGAPALAVQSLSMGLAGTDYALHREFTEATTRYRQRFVQTLNAELAAYDQVNTFDYTRGRDLWERIPAFAFEPPSAWWSLSRHQGSAITLALWLAVSVAALGWAVATMRVD